MVHRAIVRRLVASICDAGVLAVILHLLFMVSYPIFLNARLGVGGETIDGSIAKSDERTDGNYGRKSVEINVN